MAYVRVAVLLHEIVNLDNSLYGSGQLHSRFFTSGEKQLQALIG